jgi:hypothetical protein
MLQVRQAGTLRRRLPGEDREQGWLQAQELAQGQAQG